MSSATCDLHHALLEEIAIKLTSDIDTPSGKSTGIGKAERFTHESKEMSGLLIFLERSRLMDLRPNCPNSFDPQVYTSPVSKISID